MSSNKKALREERRKMQIRATIQVLYFFESRGDDDVYLYDVLSEVHKFGCGSSRSLVQEVMEELGYAEHKVPVVDQYEPRTENRWRKRGSLPQVCTFF